MGVTACLLGSEEACQGYSWWTGRRGKRNQVLGGDFQDITSLLLQDSVSPPSLHYKHNLCSRKLKICVSSSLALILLLLLLLYLAYRETDKEMNSLTNLMIDLSE